MKQDIKRDMEAPVSSWLVPTQVWKVLYFRSIRTDPYNPWIRTTVPYSTDGCLAKLGAFTLTARTTLVAQPQGEAKLTPA